MRLGNAALLLATMCTPAPSAQGTGGNGVATPPLASQRALRSSAAQPKPEESAAAPEASGARAAAPEASGARAAAPEASGARAAPEAIGARAAAPEAIGARAAAPEASGAPAAPEISPTTVCDASPVREQITQALFADQEFRDYVCEEPCSEQKFAQEFLLRQALLRERPATWGCFAEPKRQATTGLFVVFAVQNGSAHWEMSYSGISIDPKPGHQTNGYVDLEGREREYPATWLTHHFVWNGKGYVLKSTEASSSH